MSTSYLIAEEGALAGMTIAFEEGKEEQEWSLGRDPETSDIVLEDPQVSRKHALVRFTSEGFIFENLSSVNPVTQNGMIIADPVLLKEGDILQIGSTFFRFSEKTPEPEKQKSSDEEELKEEKESPLPKPPHELHLGPDPDTRWLLKVISGPNSGAEFAMYKGATYLLGKDPNICDIVFQDLSVSRQHARITITEDDNTFIEDLGSRNGVIVNGELISEKQLLASQDMVALGTTTFLIIDRKEMRETIVSPPITYTHPAPKKKEKATLESKQKRNWKEIIIPKNHLFLAAIFGGILFVSLFGMLALFKSEPVIVKTIDENEKIQSMLSKFPGVSFAFNRPSGKIFLTGNVMTTAQNQELLYTLKELPFINEIENTVVVDELVWQNMNALLSSNSDWTAVSVYGTKPGKYILRGYVETVEVAESLIDYINLNFDYLDKIENEVVVEKNLEIEVASLLIEKGFSSVKYELSNGEVVLSGRVESDHEKELNELVKEFQDIPGIRTVKNFVIVAKDNDASRIDISKNFPVTGFSRRDDSDFFVVIKGRILGQGDFLEGMLITKINPKTVLLEEGGMKYKINYNVQ